MPDRTDKSDISDKTDKTDKTIEIDATDLQYQELNHKVKTAAWDDAAKHIILKNVCGQRYIGTGVDRKVAIDVHGTPGNDLAAFGNGPSVTVFGNAQDGCGNTMNEGTVVVHGHAGDITGYAMRGGSIFVRDDVGYRVGIHMKEYMDKVPKLVIGGTAQDFLGEYMAGGILLVLGLTLTKGSPHRADHIATGMHGGTIYIRGKVDEHQLGKDVSPRKMEECDIRAVETLVESYVSFFKDDKRDNDDPMPKVSELMASDWVKLKPVSKRPYGKIYAY